jgi:hypothetical protein
VASTPPEEKAFQLRRRRAAKLTQFFGVDYRELMNEVFESLEMGLEEEGGRGTLKPEEVQVGLRACLCYTGHVQLTRLVCLFPGTAPQAAQAQVQAQQSLRMKPDLFLRSYAHAPVAHVFTSNRSSAPDLCHTDAPAST